MNIYRQVIPIAVSLIAAYLALLYTSLAAMGIVVALPLCFFRPFRSFVAGLAIGLFSSLSIYMLYPLSKVSQLASLIAQLSGLPSVLTLLLYPLLFAMMTAFSAAMWSEVLIEYRKRKAAIKVAKSSAS